MHATNPASSQSWPQREQTMLLENYEAAGLEAHARGVARSQNPFSRDAHAPAAGSVDRERLQLLAEHWWRGWDSYGGARRRCR
ncbi:MAG: hypothetical protein ACJ8G7_09600 [Rhizobacter sp.]